MICQVMAGNEDTSGSMVENSTSSRLQWLKQRRLALQDKLIEKNSELKNLCIEEAELTGILPPEIPLEPGESPPLFRRRAATSYLTELNTFNKFNQNGTVRALQTHNTRVQQMRKYFLLSLGRIIFGIGTSSSSWDYGKLVEHHK